MERGTGATRAKIEAAPLGPTMASEIHPLLPLSVRSTGRMRVRRPAGPLACSQRPKISFSQGGEWNALMSRYIGVIPLSGDPCEAVGAPHQNPPHQNPGQQNPGHQNPGPNPGHQNPGNPQQ